MPALMRVFFYFIVIKTWSPSTVSPFFTSISAIVPAVSHGISFSIFIASITRSLSPFLTDCPTVTDISITTPGRGEST